MRLFRVPRPAISPYLGGNFTIFRGAKVQRKEKQKSGQGEGLLSKHTSYHSLRNGIQLIALGKVPGPLEQESAGPRGLNDLAEVGDDQDAKRTAPGGLGGVVTSSFRLGPLSQHSTIADDHVFNVRSTQRGSLSPGLTQVKKKTLPFLAPIDAKVHD